MSDESFAIDAFELMRRLDGADIPYRVGSIRDDAIVIEVRSPGSFWEIEFFPDRPAVFEPFNSDGRILGLFELAPLIAKWSDPPPPDDAAPPSPQDPLALMRRLREASISFRVDELMIRRTMIDGAIMIEVAVPGERWEIDILPDGAIEAERFETDFVRTFGAAELMELLDICVAGKSLHRKRRGLR